MQPTDEAAQVKAPCADHCYYCNQEYHPMPVFTLKPQFQGHHKPYQIWVCHLEFIFDEAGEFQGLKPKNECKTQALQDGYEFRKDLTPKR